MCFCYANSTIEHGLSMLASSVDVKGMKVGLNNLEQKIQEPR